MLILVPRPPPDSHYIGGRPQLHSASQRARPNVVDEDYSTLNSQHVCKQSHSGSDDLNLQDGDDEDQPEPMSQSGKVAHPSEIFHSTRKTHICGLSDINVSSGGCGMRFVDADSLQRHQQRGTCKPSNVTWINSKLSDEVDKRIEEVSESSQITSNDPERYVDFVKNSSTWTRNSW